MQPISGEFGLNQHHISSLHTHAQLPQFDPVDDFLEQMLSSAVSPWGDDHSQQQMEEQSASVLASKLRQQQINTRAAKALMLQQQLLLSTAGVDGNGFKSENDASIKALFTGSLGQTSNQSEHFHQPQVQNFGGAGITTPAVTNEAAGQARQRVRARRGQATDPHSIAERLRRERIAERMKSLQELVPNANKTDKASMLDEIIDYVKFLQLQVKVLSMSRLGGASAPDMSPKTSKKKEGMSLSVTEQEVTKLMEEDMGSAMQYLQGKGLCLMPISLATAISTNTLKINANSNARAPTSPTLSVLTLQSATIGGNTNIIPDVCNP